MASRIGKKEWVAVFATTGTIDVIQWLIDFTGIGIAVNEVADPCIGVVIALYFQFRGVSMISQPKRLVAMIAGDLAEHFTGSVAPAWIIDVWYIYKSVREQEMEATLPPEGITPPRNQRPPPLNATPGIRKPPIISPPKIK